MSEQNIHVTHATTRECDRVANDGTLAHVEETRRPTPRVHAQSSARSAPAARATTLRRDEARQDTGTASRAGGATTSAEPKPSYFWDDCVMVGLAVSPHCGI